MDQLEQLAIIVVLTIVGVLVATIDYLRKAKTKAEAKAEFEALKRIEMEIRHEMEKKSLDSIVDDSNKRHGR